MSDKTDNLRRLVVLTFGGPKMTTDNWERLQGEGWEWHANIKAADYESACEFVKSLREAHGGGNVTVGDPWDIDKNGPYAASNSICGVYVRNIKPLVFSLHLDLARWEGLTEEQLDEL